MKRGNFRIKITRTGYFFIALCLGVGIAGLNTGNNLLYLVFGSMLSFIILSGLLSNNTLTKLTIIPFFPKRVFAKEPVSIHFDLKNQKKFFPSFALTLIPISNGMLDTEKTFVLKVLPQKTILAIGHFCFPTRGLKKLPSYRIQTTYPFGLIRKYLMVDTTEEIIVYPAILSTESIFALNYQYLGEYLSGQKGGSLNPYGIRDFVFGDSFRFVHWKTTAKQGKFKIKEFEHEKRMRVTIDVWLAPQKISDPKLLEKAISVAASLLVHLPTYGFEIDLNLNGKPVDVSGRSYLDSYLSVLALANPPEHHQTIARTTDDHRSIFVVSDLPRTALPQAPSLVISKETLVSIQ